MARSVSSRPGRSLGVLVAFIAVVFGVIGIGTVWGNAQWTPKLALDLEGGTEIVLTPVPQPGTSGTITQQTLDEAVNIIRQRVNGSGVSEAEITTQSGRNIVVSLPGKTDEATRESVKRAAALEFRAVLVQQPTALAEQPPATPTGTPSPGASGSASPGASATATKGASATASGASGSAAPSGSASAKASAPSGGATATLQGSSPSASASSNGMALSNALLAATPTPSGTTAPTTAPTTAGASASASTTGGASASSAPASSAPAASGSAKPSASAPAPAKPTDASDLNWIDQALATKLESLDCTKQVNQRGAVEDDLTKPLVTCSTDGKFAYILGPAELNGKDISSATASLETTSQGAVIGNTWQVNLGFKSDGGEKFAKVTQRLYALDSPRNQFAIVLDGLVVSAPKTNEAITGGQAQITGSFSQTEAQGLANQLKFGALPISFTEQTEQNISATLGGEQLQKGLLAGLIGLGLVVLYSLAQYRALGLVTIASLTIAGVITYGMVVLLGWRQGYRLSLPGVAGLIVSIGITADSFIVYFERIRDEVRDGRGLLPAVEAAWLRARRTILISDGVSFLAAVVLWLLALGGVKGFAFTLGLTTLVDVLVVFLFTHPTVALLARTQFFGGGHKLSGFDAAHLGRAVVYTGRGTTRNQPRRGSRSTNAAARATSGSAGGSSGEPQLALEKEPSSVEAAFVGSGSGPARTGTTIAERRAAAERARRQGLLTEDGSGSDDGGTPDGSASTVHEVGAGNDTRSGRKDA